MTRYRVAAFSLPLRSSYRTSQTLAVPSAEPVAAHWEKGRQRAHDLTEVRGPAAGTFATSPRTA